MLRRRRPGGSAEQAGRAYSRERGGTTPNSALISRVGFYRAHGIIHFHHEAAAAQEAVAGCDPLPSGEMPLLGFSRWILLAGALP
ncbi:MAG: hypothetical protein KDI01_05560 [Halioglobus sp.]|nr:hypothetical protein [Halioglobus sp.]